MAHAAPQRSVPHRPQPALLSGPQAWPLAGLTLALLTGVSACRSEAPHQPLERQIKPDHPTEAAALNSDPEVETVWEYLLVRYDTNGNGFVEHDEYTRDNWFRLDLDQDGRLAPEEIQGRSMIPAGPVRERVLLTSFAGHLLQADDAPTRFARGELVAALVAYDTDDDGGIGPTELEERAHERGRLGVEPDLLMMRTASGASAWEILAMRDTNGDERLSLPELEALFDELDPHDPGSPRATDGVLHLAGRPVATVGKPAPDFTLLPPGSTPDATPVKLSAFRHERPVALIFGSYT